MANAGKTKQELNWEFIPSKAMSFQYVTIHK